MNEHDESTATEEERRLTEDAKALFDESVEQLDAQTLSRLNRSRQAALADLEHGGRPFFGINQWVPAAGVAAAALVVVVLWRGEPEEAPVATTANVTDFELILAEDSFEMLEDLEFYAWIDMEGDIEEENEAGANIG